MYENNNIYCVNINLYNIWAATKHGKETVHFVLEVQNQSRMTYVYLFFQM